MITREDILYECMAQVQPGSMSPGQLNRMIDNANKAIDRAIEATLRRGWWFNTEVVYGVVADEDGLVPEGTFSGCVVDIRGVREPITAKIESSCTEVAPPAPPPPPPPPPVCAYDTDYKIHTVTGSPDGELTDFQMYVVLVKGTGVDTGDTAYLGDNVRDDFADVRFTSEDCATPLEYWRDQSTLVPGESCIFWVKLPVIPAFPGTASFRVYYGDPLAEDIGDIQATMERGDDFRSTFLSQQVDSGEGPRFCTGIVRMADNSILLTVWDNSTNEHWVYKSEDGFLTAPTLLSSFYAAGSSRSHSNLDTDGASRVYMASKNVAASAVYFKLSNDSGATWGAEVTVASGLAGVQDPVPLYVGPSQLLLFVRVTSGGNSLIQCYESADNGTSWAFKNTAHTQSMSGLNAVEDLDAVVLPSGRILVTWEREVSEKSASSLQYVSSDNNAASYTAVKTAVPTEDDVDHEGGSLALRDDGTLDLIYGSNENGGDSYRFQQIWRVRYNAGTDSWGLPVLVSESHHQVEINAVYTADDVLVHTGSRQYDATVRQLSSWILTTTRVTGDDWSARGLVQKEGLAYTLDGGAWVEGFTDNTPTRGFLVFDGYEVGDYVVEALVQAPDPLTAVDTRVVFRYGTASDHYMLTILGDSTNRVIWYKNVEGTYTTIQQSADLIPAPALNTPYRIVAKVRGVNPTVLDVEVNGVVQLSGVLDATSSRGSGTIGVSGGNALSRRATLARHVFARKYTPNEPARAGWSTP